MRIDVRDPLQGWRRAFARAGAKSGTTASLQDAAAHAPGAVQAQVQSLRRLTGLRAFAALAVFLVHLEHYHVASLPWGVSGLGGLGVAFFFVLSGFVLAWGTGPEVTPRTFYRRRFARIFPSHLVMLLVAIVVPVVAVSRSWEAGAASLLLIQAWFSDDLIVYGMNGVSWTLSCEALFYAIFPLAVLLTGHLPRWVNWTVVCIGLALAAIAYMWSPDFADHLPLVRMSEFLLGVVAGISYRDGWRPRMPGWAVAAILVLGLALSRIAGAPVSNAIMALPFLALILYAATLDLGNRRGWLSSPALVFAGEASFAFYLVHELVIINLVPVLPGTGVTQVAAMLALATVCAIVLHLLVERPCNRLLRDRAPSLALAPIVEMPSKGESEVKLGTA